MCVTQDALSRQDAGDLSLDDPLDAGQALESLPTCLDSSILSIFEDSCTPVEVNVILSFCLYFVAQQQNLV